MKEAARSFQPDVIFLDMALPDIGGAEIARQLRFEPGLEKTAIIAVSGHSGEAHRKKALDAGCVEYHVKPIDMMVLGAIVARAANGERSDPA